MYTRMLKAVWFFSLIGFMVSFMYLYATLSKEIVFDPFAIVISKDTLFYIFLFTVSIINALVFLIKKLNRADVLTIWLLGQLILLNFFFIVVLGFITLLDRGGLTAYEGVGILIYISVTAVVLWALGGLVYFVRKQKKCKLRNCNFLAKKFIISIL